jgi:glucose-6-phosphate 1-epimerase
MTATAYAIRERGPGGAPLVRIINHDLSTAQVYLHGATVTSWSPARGGERLYLSERAVLDGSAAIRGGVPICWPQFNLVGDLPRHGFARTSPWEYLGASWGEGALTARFALESDARTRAIWPADFECEYHVTVGGDVLDLRLIVRNTGSSDLSFTGALHSYLAVDSDAARLEGLRGGTYRQFPGTDLLSDERDVLTLGAAEDRLYLGQEGALMLHGGPSPLRIEKTAWPDTVVWNPHTNAANIPDMRPEDWKRFICVEAACVAQPIVVPPGGAWAGAQTLTAL